MTKHDFKVGDILYVRNSSSGNLHRCVLADGYVNEETCSKNESNVQFIVWDKDFVAPLNKPGGVYLIYEASKDRYHLQKRNEDYYIEIINRLTNEKEECVYAGGDSNFENWTDITKKAIQDFLWRMANYGARYFEIGELCMYFFNDKNEYIFVSGTNFDLFSRIYKRNVRYKIENVMNEL